MRSKLFGSIEALPYTRAQSLQRHIANSRQIRVNEDHLVRQPEYVRKLGKEADDELSGALALAKPLLWCAESTF